MFPFSALLKAVCFSLALQCSILTSPALAQNLPAAATPAIVPSAVPATTAPHSSAPGENPYGLKAVWEQGDMVAKGTLCILVFMSVFSWYLIISKLLDQRRMLSQQQEAVQGLGETGNLAQTTQKLQSNSPFRFVAQEGLSSAAKHREMGDAIEFNGWVMLSLQRATTSIQQSMQKGLSFLATVGSTAPFVGLFGTVWGIYNALVSIGLSGQASIDKVAGPVGESLIMTAIGLAVAVPAVLGYNLVVRRNKLIMQSVQKFSGQIHASLLVASNQK
jgi:biopolymer transport protein ExbB